MNRWCTGVTERSQKPCGARNRSTDTMSKSRDLIFIVGRQRSGTTVLRNLFVSHGALDADEIFHGTLNHKYRFYEFVHQAVQRDKSLIYPIHHHGLFAKYIDFLRSESKGAPIALDVKYFAFNLLSTSYNLQPPKPFLTEFIKHHGGNVLHLVRRNKLRIYLSERVSQKTGVWSVTSKRDIPENRSGIQINLDHMIAALEQLELQTTKAEKIMGTLPEAQTLYYEDLFDTHGNFRPAIGTLLTQIMGPRWIDLRPTTVRMNTEPLSELIQNFAAVRKRLKGTRYEWMLHEG